MRTEIGTAYRYSADGIRWTRWTRPYAKDEAPPLVGADRYPYAQGRVHYVDDRGRMHHVDTRVVANTGKST